MLSRCSARPPRSTWRCLSPPAQSDVIFHRDEDEALTRTILTEPLERLLRDCAADGSLRAVDPVETATVLFNVVGWTYIHLRTGHGWQPERACSATLDPVLRGLLTRRAAAFCSRAPLAAATRCVDPAARERVVRREANRRSTPRPCDGRCVA